MPPEELFKAISPFVVVGVEDALVSFDFEVVYEGRGGCRRVFVGRGRGV